MQKMLANFQNYVNITTVYVTNVEWVRFEPTLFYEISGSHLQNRAGEKH